MSDMEIEKEIQEKGCTAPRVTPELIESVISGEYYINGSTNYTCGVEGCVASHAEALGLLTICVLVLVNGFTVVGKSACASAANFDLELGKKIARKDAVSQIWLLEGYALKERLSIAPVEAPK